MPYTTLMVTIHLKHFNISSSDNYFKVKKLLRIMDTTVRAVVSQMSSSYGCLFSFIHNQLIHSHI